MESLRLQFTKVTNGWIIDEVPIGNRAWVAKGDYCYYEITEIVQKILAEFEKNLCQQTENTKMP